MSVAMGSAPLDWRDSLPAFPVPAHIGELLLRAARCCPEGHLLGVSAETKGADLLNYSSLLKNARRIAGGLGTNGCRPGTPVVLLLERALDFLPAFWGCVLAGLIPCPLAPIRTDSKRCAQQL